MKTKFEKGSSVYTCEGCNKRTRQVGDEPHGVCNMCWESQGDVNWISDNGLSMEDEGDHAEILADLCNNDVEYFEKFKVWYEADKARYAAR